MISDNFLDWSCNKSTANHFNPGKLVNLVKIKRVFMYLF